MAHPISDRVRLSARIREFRPWESDEKCYELEAETSTIFLIESPSSNRRLHKTHHSSMYMTFNGSVFDSDCDNNDVFEGTAKTLCDNVVETGFNSLLCAFGQIGSGKTFTLLGDRDAEVKGVLTQSIEYLLHHKSGRVSKCWMKAIELYSTTQHHQDEFDLLAQVRCSRSLTLHDSTEAANVDRTMITRDTDVDALIAKIQEAAHYAPTSNNPRSSRGNIVFVIEIEMKDGHVCHFLCLDLAGVQGISATTPEFEAEFGIDVAATRLQEAGCINYALQQIEAILVEAGSGGVSAVKGDGLRKVLWEYLQPKCNPICHILMTLSPSADNIKSSRHTFRVSRTIAGLSIRPERVERRVQAIGDPKASKERPWWIKYALAVFVCSVGWLVWVQYRQRLVMMEEAVQKESTRQNVTNWSSAVVFALVAAFCARIFFPWASSNKVKKWRRKEGVQRLSSRWSFQRN